MTAATEAMRRVAEAPKNGYDAEAEDLAAAEADTRNGAGIPEQAPDLGQLADEELAAMGRAYLDEACSFINRFSVLPSRAAGYALVLFAAHCWIYRAFTETPRMHISANDYGAGKTRVMKLVNLLCPNPQMMAKLTGPAAYHVISERCPAPLALDEADAIFGQGQRAEDLRGILNAGYEYSGTVTRVSKGEATDFGVFCPVIFAGKGQLPKSLADRAVTVMMCKRRAGQEMDRFVPKMHDATGRQTGLMLGAWATRVQGPAGDILWADPPEKLEDRQVDILTPFYALAQMAGGDWPARFDEIVEVLVLGGVSTDQKSPAEELLEVIREVWPENTERLPTHKLADLVAEHDSGRFDWPAEVRTAELNARMRDMGLAPVPMRINGTVMRGYDRETVTAAQGVTGVTRVSRGGAQ